MINQSTIDKLIEMRLTAMADAFRIQMDDKNMQDVPFEDRFGMLIDVENIPAVKTIVSNVLSVMLSWNKRMHVLPALIINLDEN